MPELYRRPRRRRGGVTEDDFTDEAAVRAAVAEVRSRYASIDAAESSDEWRALSRRVLRWVLRTWRGLPVVAPESRAIRCARIYLRRPGLLPPLPPALSRLHEGEEE